jgi:hypothetical protein
MNGRVGFTAPPRAVRTAKLDNIALVPGNLLRFKASWQPIANRLPPGSMLIYLPPEEKPSRQILERVAVGLKQHGRHVVTLVAPRVT